MLFIGLKIFAYIGPGLGGGALAAIIGVIISFFLALFAILWYPFKKMIARFKKKKDDE